MQQNIVIGVAAYAIADGRHAGWNYYGNREQDIKAIRRAGGTPVLIPPFLEGDDAVGILERLDGLYLAGGGDIDASFLGIPTTPLIQNIDLERDRMELALARLAYRLNLSVLGVCRGSQVMAAALGGRLVIDIPAEIKGAISHNPQEPAEFISHPVQLAADSRLASIYGRQSLMVNSYHHQAVRAPGENLTVTARAADGVVEAVEAPDRDFYVGLQWHPEREAGNDADISKIFDAFVGAARKNG
ncbi:MAG: gamma-glutamyl-gamma-aminobutyrate hydrolase family protein [Anaerolineae bacterium]|nr:gamma-glutamyl-gamma-aminobutyrate hydrolase family protein [Anaerolineae bacterium]